MFYLRVDDAMLFFFVSLLRTDREVFEWKKKHDWNVQRLKSFEFQKFLIVQFVRSFFLKTKGPLWSMLRRKKFCHVIYRCKFLSFDGE